MWPLARRNLANTASLNGIDPTTPASPTSLVAAGNAISINLAWKDNANNEQAFKIERRVAWGEWLPCQTVGANITAYNDAAVVAGTTYFYRVYAYNATAPSLDYSNEAAAGLTMSQVVTPVFSIVPTNYSSAQTVKASSTTISYQIGSFEVLNNVTIKPTISLERSADSITLSWPTGIKLQSSAVMSATHGQDVPGSETNTSLRLPIGTSNQFYRLK